MAYLIPENIPSRSDIHSAVQEVARTLRDHVGDDVTVWYEEVSPPALVILDPEAGLLLLQVSALDGRDVKKSGGILGFLKQQKLAFKPAEELLTKADEYRSRLDEDGGSGASIPVGAAVAVPALARESALNAGASLIDLENVLLREDLEPNAIVGALRSCLGGGRPRLAEPQERLARAAVRPEIVIGRDKASAQAAGQLVFQAPLGGGEDLIRVLDRQQERLAHHLGNGYQVIRGVAGSGKSLVLTFRAKHLAKHFPNERFLLTCFNVVLSRALEKEVEELSNIDVATVDSLANRYANYVGSKRTRDDWRRARESAADTVRRNPNVARYAAVFVDEAQDLDPAGLNLAYSFLRKGSKDFVLALDGAQNVYRRNAKWNPANTTARGRTTILRTCYRNTYEIAAFAWRFLASARIGVFNEEDLDDPTLVIPPELTERHGPQVGVVQCKDPTAEVDYIIRRIESAHAQGVPWHDMVVLYGSGQAKRGNRWYKLGGQLYYKLKEKGVPYFRVLYRDEKDEAVAAGDVVRSSTFQLLKGVEFSRVFMCAVNDIWDPGGEDDPTRFRLAYVGMTRAMDELVITVSGEGPIGQAIQAAADA